MYTLLYLNDCGYSEAAKNLLETNDLDYKSLIFSSDIEGDEKKFFKKLNKEYKVEMNSEGKNVFDKKMFKDYFGKEATFPRIYKNGEYIGGYNDLESLL